MANARSTMSREARAVHARIEKGLGQSVADIQAALRTAERRIEADARGRISRLRREARAQLRVLESRRRETSRILGRLSTAAGASWRDVKKSTDRTLREVRAVAKTAVGRFREAVRG